MIPDPTPEDTLTFPVVADTETMQPVPETEVLPALPEPSFAGASLTGQPEPRPFPLFPIGDALISSVPGFDTEPCGHCRAVFGSATPAVLTAVRPLMELRSLAYDEGWGYDRSLIWTCPDCKQAAAERVTAPDRAEAEAVADAEHEHRAILAAFDRRAAAAMEARGWEFTCRWSYTEAAAPGWAA
jgi:hypothetical protein